MTEKFAQALGFQCLDPFSQCQQAGSMSHSHSKKKKGNDERLVRLEVSCEADGGAFQERSDTTKAEKQANLS